MAHENITVHSDAWQLAATAPALCMIQSRRSVVYAKVAASTPGPADRGFFVMPSGITFPDLSEAGLNIYLRAQDASDDVSVLTL